MVLHPLILIDKETLAKKLLIFNKVTELVTHHYCPPFHLNLDIEMLKTYQT